MTASTTNMNVTPARGRGVPEPRRARLARDLNAVFAIAWREILRAVKSPLSIAFTVIFPILFIGILGGSISQNLSAGLSYAYLPFMLIGMVANGMYQGTITGVTNLVEERENDFTAELFVAPISRYAVLVGKLIGSGVAAMVSLIGVVAMIVVMQIPMNFGDLLRVIALAPMLALAGGALGVFLIGLSQDSKVVAVAVPLLDLPADLPVGGAHSRVRIERHPRPARPDHPDDLFDRPRPQYLLLGQAGVRGGGPPRPVARPRRHRGLLPRVHDRRDCAVRAGGFGTADARNELLVGVGLGSIDGCGEVGAGHAARFLALRPVQLLVDLLLGVAAFEERLLGRV